MIRINKSKLIHKLCIIQNNKIMCKLYKIILTVNMKIILFSVLIKINNYSNIYQRVFKAYKVQINNKILKVMNNIVYNNRIYNNRIYNNRIYNNKVYNNKVYKISYSKYLSIIIYKINNIINNFKYCNKINKINKINNININNINNKINNTNINNINNNKINNNKINNN